MKKQDRKPEVFTGLRSCFLSEIVGAAVAVTGGNAAEMAVQLPVLCRMEGETRLGRVETVSACGDMKVRQLQDLHGVSPFQWGIVM